MQEPRDSVDDLYLRLSAAVIAGRTERYCLRIWSRFIKARDGHRCVDCHSKERLAAHHIARKTLFIPAKFDPGNGITLCPSCHRELHTVFNGRPDLSQPFDAEGGEKLDLMERLYYILVDDAADRGVLVDEHYAIGDPLLRVLKRMQGLSADHQFAGCGAWQAYQALATPSSGMLAALIKANFDPSDED